MLTAGFSKAYSSLLAFAAVPASLRHYLKLMVPTYCYGGPVPVASLATTLLGLEANERRGDELRAQLWHRTRTLLDHLDKLGVATSNTSGFPLVELAIADPGDQRRGVTCSTAASRDPGPTGGPPRRGRVPGPLTAANTADQSTTCGCARRSTTLRLPRLTPERVAPPFRDRRAD